MPWYTLLLAPVLSMALGILGGIVYQVKSFSLPGEHRRDTLRVILVSLLQGPMLGLAGFYSVLMLLSTVMTALSFFSQRRPR